MELSTRIDDASKFAELWKTLLDEQSLPPIKHFLIWLIKYEPKIIERGIERTAVWYQRECQKRIGGIPDRPQFEGLNLEGDEWFPHEDYFQALFKPDEPIRYASGVMSAIKRSKLEVPNATGR